MNFDAIDRLLALRVSDVMSRGVVVLKSNQTLAEAAELFRDHDVTAAPVVDQNGKCIGMLTATDFARHAQPFQDGEVLASAEKHELVQSPDGWCIESKPHDWVECCMTRTVKSIDEHASLLAAARVLCEQHLHRLPVLDQHRPIGVISSMDVVSALVNAFDEMHDCH